LLLRFRGPCADLGSDCSALGRSSRRTSLVRQPHGGRHASASRDRRLAHSANSAGPITPAASLDTRRFQAICGVFRSRSVSSLAGFMLTMLRRPTLHEISNGRPLGLRLCARSGRPAGGADALAGPGHCPPRRAGRMSATLSIPSRMVVLGAGRSHSQNLFVLL
jgi:hypothetical protein